MAIGDSNLENIGPGIEMSREYMEAHNEPKSLGLSAERIDSYNDVCEKIKHLYTVDGYDTRFNPEIRQLKVVRDSIEKITKLENVLKDLLTIEPKEENVEKYHEYLEEVQDEIQKLKLKLGENNHD